MEQYFNYMGLLAVEGSYDNMYKMLECARPAASHHTLPAPRTVAVGRGQSVWRGWTLSGASHLV